MKTLRPRVIGAFLITATLLAAVCIQIFGRGLVWIDQHPVAPPEIAAKSGFVVGSATHFSLAIVPLVLTLTVGFVCLLLRKRDETPVA